MNRRQLEDRARHRRVARGLWVPRDRPGNIWDRCCAIRPALPADAVFSHYTAAALLHVTVPDEPLIHICTMQPIEPRITGVVGHRILTMGEADRWVVRGLPTTSAGRTYLDLANRLDLVSLVIAGDGLSARDPDGVDGLARAVAAGTGRRGVKLARVGLPLLNPASKSPMESRLRFLVVTDGLGNPLVCQPASDAAGEWIAEPDLQWPEFKVAVEYEGEHHREKRQWELDIRRDENLHANGWILIKVTATDLLVRPAATLQRIRDALLSRGWRP